MHKTPFSKRLEILGTFWIGWNDYYVIDEDQSEDEREDAEFWIDFFNTVGDILESCYSFSYGYSSIVPSMVDADEAWEYFCFSLGVDKDDEYNSVVDMFIASNKVS